MAKKPNTLKPVRYNKLLKARLRKLFVSISGYVRDQAIDKLLPFVSMPTAKPEAAKGDPLADAFAALKGNILKLMPEIQRKLQSIFDDMSDNTRAKFGAEMKNKVGVDLSVLIKRPAFQDQIQLSVKQNLGLISTMTDKQVSQLQGMMYQQLRSGQIDIGALREKITKDFGRSKDYADRIALDQTHKLNAAISEICTKSIGSNKYIWRNSQDRRVRGNPAGLYPHAKHDHWARESEIFYWNKPPPGGHPGQDYNCRCYAEPVLPDEYEKLLFGDKKQ